MSLWGTLWKGSGGGGGSGDMLKSTYDPIGKNSQIAIQSELTKESITGIKITDSPQFTNEKLTGQLNIDGATSGTVSIKSPAIVTTYTLTLPNNDGNNNQVLITDGNGITSWSNQTGEANVGGNIGSGGGVGIYKDKSGVMLRFKSLIASPTQRLQVQADLNDNVEIELIKSDTDITQDNSDFRGLNLSVTLNQIFSIIYPEELFGW